MLSWSNSTPLAGTQWNITASGWVQLKLITLQLKGTFLDAYWPWLGIAPTWLATPSPLSLITIDWYIFSLSPSSPDGKHNCWMSYPSLTWPLFMLQAYWILLLMLYLEFLSLEFTLPLLVLGTKLFCNGQWLKHRSWVSMRLLHIYRAQKSGHIIDFQFRMG